MRSFHSLFLAVSLLAGSFASALPASAAEDTSSSSVVSREQTYMPLRVMVLLPWDWKKPGRIWYSGQNRSGLMVINETLHVSGLIDIRNGPDAVNSFFDGYHLADLKVEDLGSGLRVEYVRHVVNEHEFVVTVTVGAIKRVILYRRIDGHEDTVVRIEVSGLSAVDMKAVAESLRKLAAGVTVPLP